MKILALESSAIAASVAVCEEDRLLGEYLIRNGNTHSQTLLPMTEALLTHLGLTPNDIELFAVSKGPGSFTGIRIGVATLKGLAFGKDRPCIGVSTLEALAYNLPCIGLICPVMNARRGQVYTALFRCNGESYERLLPDSALSLQELDELLSAYAEPVFLVGDGYDITSSALQHPIGYTPERLRHQSAASVARVAWLSYRNGISGTDAELSPTYLRPCQAERERAERLRAEQQP